MSWALERFGTVTLPTAVPHTPIGTGPGRDGIVRTADDFYDGWGTAQGPLELPYELTLTTTTTGATAAALLATLQALKRTGRTRAHLIRRLSTGGVEWCWARLTQITAEREVQHLRFQPVEMRWLVLSPWYGYNHSRTVRILDDGWYLDDGYYLDSVESFALTNDGPAANTLGVTNGGDTACTNVIMTITAAGSNITALDISISNVADLEFSSTIVNGKALVIDCGAKSVLNDGADAAAYFATGTNHKSNYWLPLAVGSNTISVVRTGGGAASTIAFEFSEPVE